MTQAPPRERPEQPVPDEDRRNAVERVKGELDPLDIRPRIERYAREGYASIDPDDLKVRFRWWGLYTQRPEEAGYFMMRIRIAGGALTSGQLEAIGRISRDRCRDLADVTDRQNVQLHWVVIQDVPKIWDELAKVGLESGQTCGDTVRNILGCPVAGVDAGEVFDAGPDLRAADARLTHTKEFTNLPRKYKLSISGCRDHCAMHEINDGGLVGVQTGDGRLGYDVWVGGGLSSSPRFAERLGVFVAREQATEFLVALTSLFREHGGRDKRTRARLKFLVGAWGVDKLRKVLEEDYLGHPLEDGPEAPPSATVHRDHVGVYRQHDGNFYVGVSPLVGRVSGSQLIAVAKLARELGKGRVRLTTQQKILVLDVPRERVGEAVARLDELGLPAYPSPFWRGAMACTGMQFCKLALVETKQRASDLVHALERRFPDFDAKVRLNVNGCPNSCARYQLADVGLAGGESAGEGNFQLHLGGDLGEARALGHRVRSRVDAEDAEGVVGQLLGAYLEAREDGESVQSWLRRQPAEQLAELSRSPVAARSG
jgi:sulfite reductase (ferredoxin)